LPDGVGNRGDPELRIPGEVQRLPLRIDDIGQEDPLLSRWPAIRQAIDFDCATWSAMYPTCCPS
jgi:hypothetical protein